MRIAATRAFSVILAGLAIELLQCSSSAGNGDKVFGTPEHHYPAGSACRTTRPAGDVHAEAGAPCGDCHCTDDTQCVGGLNGRCIVTGNGGGYCSYDTCIASSDCASGNTCACGDLEPDSYNECVPSNCRVDTDCGSNGFCSPSPSGACGNNFNVYNGVYCHTPQDDCASDSDCPGGTSTYASTRRCIFSKDAGKWTCGVVQCGAG